MKNIIKVFLAITVVASLSQCTEVKKPVDLSFWTSDGPDVVHILYVDGVAKGTVPYKRTGFDCDHKPGKNETLHLVLNSGTYNIEMKDSSGNVLMHTSFHFSISNKNVTVSTESKEEHGGLKTVMCGDSGLITELFY